ncbi:MAG: CotH kinase family protein [Clostridia bacterium]|nr:CotH kinase family protein [Clostridia bacterium]
MLALAFGIYIETTDHIHDVRFMLPTADEQEAVALYENSGVYYAFLPSYAQTDTMTIIGAPGNEIYIDGKMYAPQTLCGDLEIDKPYSLQLKDAWGLTIADSQLILKQAQNVPALSIHLTDGSMDDINADKTIDKSGTISIIKSDRQLNYEGKCKNLRGRGNTTWDQPKKSYTLELTEDGDLLGMGAAKKWVLLSDSFDESHLRNKLAYDAAYALGVDFTVDSEYVDFYVDDVYYGVYLLCEKVEIDRRRVAITDLAALTKAINPVALSGYPAYQAVIDGKLQKGFDITNNPQDITGGYLFQIEHHDDRIQSGSSAFQTDDLSFSLSSPAYASKEQIQYLSDYVNQVEDAIAAGDLSGIDVDSFARYYLIQELFANNDNCSVYFYKDIDARDPKLHTCSIWDFDLSIGNSWLVPNMSPQAFYRNTDNWFDRLYAIPAFRERLQTIYAEEISPYLTDWIADQTTLYRSQIGASFSMDKLRWQNVQGDNDWADRSQNRFDTLEEHAAYIQDFMEKRLAFLNSAWIDGKDYATVTFSTYTHTSFKASYAVEKGGLLDVLPDPSSTDTAAFTFLGWFDENGEAYTAGAVIDQDKAYTAQWALADNGILAKLQYTLLEKIDQLQYDVGPIALILLAVFAVVFLAVLIISSRQNRVGRKRKRGDGS